MRKLWGITICMLGLSGTLMGATSDRRLSEWSIVPIQYENKAFIKGEYVDIDRDFEIFTEEGTVYIPFRLLAELLSTYEEGWRVNWVSNKPDEVTLDVDHMRTNGELGLGQYRRSVTDY